MQNSHPVRASIYFIRPHGECRVLTRVRVFIQTLVLESYGSRTFPQERFIR